MIAENPFFMLGILRAFIFINVVTFFVWGIDKRKAEHHKWRISEKTLLILSALGGRIGALTAVDIFAHKTQKSSFARKLYLIGGIRIIGLCVFAYFCG